MNRIKVFDFGPELGPLSGRRPEPVQGKGLVWVGSSPLDPGHFVLGPAPLIGVDEPIGGDPGIGGGGGLGGGNRGFGGGGSGGSGTGVGFLHPIGVVRRPLDPPVDCADWTYEIGPGRRAARCSPEIQAKLKAAYLELSRSVKWANFLAQLGLYTCVRNRSFCDFEFDCGCAKPNYDERTKYQQREQRLKPYLACFDPETFDNTRLLELKLTFILFRTCGVKFFEAHVLSEAFAQDVGWTFTAEERRKLLENAVSKGDLRVEDVVDDLGRKRRIYYGDYLWYDSESGECGPYPMINITFPVSPQTRRRWKLF